MRSELRELWKYRELLLSMVERELRIRYKNSYFGFFWSLLNPLITVLVMTVVFKYFLQNTTGSLSAYMFAAFLPFMFFQMALLDSAQSILNALPVVRKVYFPREILPLAGVISNFIHLLLALGVYFVYLLAVWALNPGESPFTFRIVLLPVLLTVHLALTTGLSLYISALNAFYEDVKYILAVVLYLLYFLCPVMYFSEQVRYSKAIPVRYADAVYIIYHLNPIAMLCTAYRKTLVAPKAPIVNGRELPILPLNYTLLGITTVISFVILWSGYRFFNRVKWKFVERP